MLPSLNTFGGLSSAEILILFGSNSPSSSSNATHSSTTQSAQTGVDASGANNPANAIQAILAQADMAHAQLETSLADSGSILKAQAAYADQMAIAGSPVNLGDTNSESFVSQSNAYSLTNSSLGVSAINTSQETVYSDQTISTSSSVGVSPVGSSPAAGSASSALNFQLSASITEQSDDQSAALSIDLGFSVQGLGDLTATNTGGEVIQAHAPDAQHAWSDEFQLNIDLNGQATYLTLNVEGLDQSQAQNVLTAFQKSAAEANIAPWNPNEDQNLSISYFAGSGVNYNAPIVHNAPIASASSQQT
jgi:hypothetical protein